MCELNNLILRLVVDEKKIVVIGSCNTDMVVKSAKLPHPGETVLGGSFLMNQGGKGANQAVAIARMGGNVTFVSKIGNDLFGKKTIEMFGMENINTDYIFSDPQLPSGVALIMVDNNGENCIMVASGANLNLCSEDIDKAGNLIDNADIVLIQLEIPMKTVEYASNRAFQKGIKVILNPAPATFLSNELLKNLYAIIPNTFEAEMLSGIKITDWESAQKASDLISLKGVDIVIITMGSKGAFVKDRNSYFKLSAEKNNIVDTTSAGDTFCGAFCVGISEGLSIKDAAQMANSAAGISVTRDGAQSSIPFRREIRFSN